MSIDLCEIADVVQRNGGVALNAQQMAAAPGLISEASVLLEGELNHEYNAGDVIPRVVTIVCSRMVKRSLTEATGSFQPGQTGYGSNFGPMGKTATFGEDVVFQSPWISKADRTALSRLGQRSVVNVSMVPNTPIPGPWWPETSYWATVDTFDYPTPDIY